MRMPIALTVAALLCASATRAGEASYDPEERSIDELQHDMTAGRVSSEQLVRAYLDRIARLDASGPALHAVLALNPNAIADARALDAERKGKHVRGPLHGIPILVKDNIETLELPTTAGSLALKDNITQRDAPAVARLRAAGAVILGKTNLSEWANMRGDYSTSGWSAVGGLTRNPYALDRTACGSSSGSGAGVAASLAAAALGTETDGSVVCPSSMNGVVGLKPTVGLVSRRFVVPISSSQDTIGPMARNVRDVATLLTVLAGSDVEDAATQDADAHKQDYVTALANASLKGKRLGVLRFTMGANIATDAVFDDVVRQLKAQGATVVEIKTFVGEGAMRDNEWSAMKSEFHDTLDRYLASTPPQVGTRSLKDVIAFNQREAGRELAWFGQQAMEQSVMTLPLTDPAYQKAIADAQRVARVEGIDKMLADQKLDALIAPTGGPAFRIDAVVGDSGFGGCSSIAAVAGYPHLSVPMGHVHGLPVALSFIGPAWSEARLLALGHAFEQRTHARKPPTFAPTLPLP